LQLYEKAAECYGLTDGHLGYS